MHDQIQVLCLSRGMGFYLCKAIVNQVISDVRQVSNRQSGWCVTKMSHTGSGIGVSWEPASGAWENSSESHDW